MTAGVCVSKQVQNGSGRKRRMTDEDAYDCVAAVRGGKVNDGIDWPKTEYDVIAGSRIANYRVIVEKTFPEEWNIDLPSAEQWEYAARGTPPDNWLCSAEGVETDSLETVTNLFYRIAVWSNNVGKDGLNKNDIGQ